MHALVFLFTFSLESIARLSGTPLLAPLLAPPAWPSMFRSPSPGTLSFGARVWCSRLMLSRLVKHSTTLLSPRSHHVFDSNRCGAFSVTRAVSSSCLGQLIAVVPHRLVALRNNRSVAPASVSIALQPIAAPPAPIGQRVIERPPPLSIIIGDQTPSTIKRGAPWQKMPSAMRSVR